MVAVLHCPFLNDSMTLLNTSDTEYDTLVTITCYPGYVVNGHTSELVLCGSDGKWSPANSTCKRT